MIRMRLVIILAVAALAIVGCSSSKATDPAAGWGHAPASEASLLHLTCQTVATINDGSAKCVLVNGGNVGVQTSTDEAAQTSADANLKSIDPNVCLVVGKGFIVIGDTVAHLDAATGDVHTFASQHGAQLDGACT